MTHGAPILLDMHQAHMLRRAPAPPAPTPGTDGAGKAPGISDITPGTRAFVRSASTPDVRRVGTAAYVRIDGALMDDVGWLYDWGCCLTHRSVADEILRQAADPTVATIVLELNCPGWGASGCTTTLDALRTARASKRLVALVNSGAFSGGMWMASECEEVSIVPEGRIGSIGSIIHSVTDEAFMAKQGFTPEVIASHPDKACGYPGVPWTDSFREMQRAIVAEHTATFFADVAAGRGLTVKAVEAMHAHYYAAKEAVRLRLADRIETASQHESRIGALAPRTGGPAARVAAPSPPPSPQPEPVINPAPSPDGEDPEDPEDASTAQGDPMDLSKLTLDQIRQGNPTLLKQMEEEASAKTAQEVAAAIAAKDSAPASFARLKEIYGDDATGVVRAMEGKMTEAQAREDHARSLRDQLTAANARAAEAEKKAKSTTGVPPVTESGAASPGAAGGPGAQHEYMRQVNATVEQTKCSLAEAMRIVARRSPELHRDYCLTTAHQPKATSPAIRKQ